MCALYHIDEIISATGGQARNICNFTIDSISMDSRNIGKNALFVAIKGRRFDGHDFVKSAIESGANAALIGEKFANKFDSLPLIIVPDPLRGLENIAHYARNRSKAKIIAVTGSAGKTSSKEIIKSVLSNFALTHASIKSYNNHWGVPLMLSSLDKRAKYAIFELGMNNAGEISTLSKLVRPDIALITNIAPAHLEQLGSLENIALAKSEIFTGLKKSGLAIINIDNNQANILLQEAKKAKISEIITYGFADNAHVRITNIVTNSDNMSADIIFPDKQVKLTIANFGQHRIVNGCAALIIAHNLGLDIEKSLQIIAKQQPHKGRGEMISLKRDGKELLLIDDSYNANPLSMRASLEVFANLAKNNGKKILVLGDMLELGKNAKRFHKELKPFILKTKPDIVFLIGEHMRSLAKLFEADESDILVKYDKKIENIDDEIINKLDFGDMIMVKGSLGTRLGTIVARIKTEFASLQEETGNR